jgi:hypothetical protein
MKRYWIISLFSILVSVACVDKVQKGGTDVPGNEPGELPQSSLGAGESPSMINSGYYESTKPSNADSSCVGHMLSAFPVNAALLTDGNRQYVGYYEGNHQMVIAQRTLPSGPWKYCKLDEFIDWDPHCYITMVKNRQGCLLVSGNMHMDPMVMFTTDESGEISTLRRIAPVVDASKEVSTTYPRFLHLLDGTLIFHYRDGKSGDGVEIYHKQNPDGSFSPYLDVPLIDGTVGGYNMSAYMIEPTMGPDGNYHLVWVWRDNGNAETCHDLSYAWSPDLKTWYGYDGNQINLPIDFTRKQLIVDPVPAQGGINNSGITLGFDTDARPMIGYFKFDENGHTNVYIARLEDGRWNIKKVSDTQWRWYFSGTGTLIKQFTIGQPVVESDGEITIWYRRYEADGTKIDGKECWLHPETLEVMLVQNERSKVSEYPDWSRKVMTPYDGEGSLRVNYVTDSGSASSGARYFLRWDSLPNNRDAKPTVKIPQPSKLIVVKY